jgi:hypothetical protein
MSATALPITSSRFAAALRELPISSLHAKVSELQNSIAHLEQSNEELEKFVREEGDKDCYEALMENREVVERNLERIELIKKEVVELRGLPWEADEVKTAPAPAPATSEAGLNGAVESGSAGPPASGSAAAGTNGLAQGQANGETPEAEEGVYL